MGLLKALAAVLSLTVVSASPLKERDLTLPTDDSFYSQPSGFENASPGTILKHRKPPNELGDFGTIPLDLKSSHQIQYRTTNSKGNPDTAVTTVLVPSNGNMSRLLSFQDIQDACYLDCAPSYAIQVGSSYNNTLSKTSSLFEAGLLTQGFIVSIPDYQGTQAAFSSGLQAGQATLDSIRAVQSSSHITGISKNLDIAMWGYSGGSIATGWAAELQPSYAPELKLIGAAIGGTVANLNNTIKTIGKSKSKYTGLGVAGVWGLYQSHKELQSLIDSETFPENRTELEKPRSQCAEEDEQTFKDKEIFSYFRSGEGILNREPLKSIIEKTGIMGKRDLPQIPLYFYKAKGDQVNHIDDNDKLVKNYCDRGIASLHYVRNLWGSHTSEAIVGSGGAMAFLKDRFEGVNPQKGCKTDNPWIMQLDWEGLKMFGDLVLGFLEGLMHMPLK